tara:strand:- start:11799 stop:12392 length:594 start_codon:yes stop_codon:yes gene_type:complete
MSNNIFYVCSYGGCGSTMLCNYLKQYGQSFHIHSRNPPNKLEYTGTVCGGNVHHEHFNGIKIPDNKINQYKVIFIYKNPIKSIYSIFKNPNHLKHIELPHMIQFDKVIEEEKDLYRINEFYNNYVHKKNKNYKIYCIKYEDLFENMHILHKVLGLPPIKNKLIKKEKIREESHKDILEIIYKDLLNEMKQNQFIMVK